MSFYTSHARLGAYGAAGFEVFPGGPSFQERWSLDDFTGASAGWLSSYNVQQTGYVPPSQGLLRAASAIWAQVNASIDPADLAFADKISTQMHTLVGTIDNYTTQHTSGTRSPSIENARVDAMKQLQKLIRQIAAYHPSTASLTIPTSTSVPLTSTQSGQTGSKAPAAPDSGSNTMLYVGLGLGAVVLIGGALALRKKSSMSGYKKRRRR
jgi:hypothetical protein